MQSVERVYNDRYIFRVWAPFKERMVLHIVHPRDVEIEMQKNKEGYFDCTTTFDDDDIQYFFKPDGKKDTPDPASHYQPNGVHECSQVVDHTQFPWTDNKWQVPEHHDLIIYELHTGTFTPEGTFEAIIPRLRELKSIGVNAIELMPVAQFPGNRNWGYDGVYPYAVQNSYGGPDGLKKLVDACHNHGIAVFLDVVYNHQGPEGNYFNEYGPYFTNQYCTPWGDAINFDGEWSDAVREYYSENAIHWLNNYHIDGLRFDAIHAVFDNGAVHFWQLLADKVKKLRSETNKDFFLVAESDLNSPRVVRDTQNDGYGFDAQWLDDFHHALYVLVNPEDRDRYYDFGSIHQLAKAYKEGFVHSGEWVEFRKRKHGASSAGISGDRFVAFNLNHDQVGNRPAGERLCMLVNRDRLKLAAAALMLAPYIPMLFMGEEYADETPFFYFVSHSDKNLIESVREGRKEEFKEFGFGNDLPDAQAEETFIKSKMEWQQRNTGKHQLILQWHKQLIDMRRSLPALKNLNKENVQVEVLSDHALALIRGDEKNQQQVISLFNFGQDDIIVTSKHITSKAKKILDSRSPHWSLENESRRKEHTDVTEPGVGLRLYGESVVVFEVKGEK